MEPERAAHKLSATTQSHYQLTAHSPAPGQAPPASSLGPGRAALEQSISPVGSGLQFSQPEKESQELGAHTLLAQSQKG